MEPFPRTRFQHIAGIKPPFMVVLWHYMRQLGPVFKKKLGGLNYRFIVKWTGIGIGGIAALLLLTVVIERQESSDLSTKARHVSDEAKAKIAADAKHKRDLEIENFITEQAMNNWENWNRSFIEPSQEKICYHAHYFNTSEKVYRITCHVGPKGFTPIATVVCTQDVCTVSEYTSPPVPGPKP